MMFISRMRPMSENSMNLLLRSALVVLVPLMLAGCISLSSSNPPPPKQGTTIVVPPSSPPATCANGTAPPC